MMEIGEISGEISALFFRFSDITKYLSFGTDDMLLSEVLIPVK
jgi:hypothetical protein